MTDDWVSFTDDLERPTASPGTPITPWKILVVDDDFEIHGVTQFVLRDRRIFGRPLQLLHAYNSQQAHAQLREHRDIAVALLDVVMETEQGGLDLIHHIRDELGLMECQIILRTGQPSYAPELSVVDQYDINAYRTKAELTHTRLISTISTALRCYQQLRNLAPRHPLPDSDPASTPYQWLPNAATPTTSLLPTESTLATLAHGQEQMTLVSLNEAIITTDTDALVNYLNPAAEILTGWIKADAYGHSLSEIAPIINKKTRKPDPDRVARCLAQGKIVQLAGQSLLIDRNQQEHDIEDSIAPIYGQDGQTLGVVLVLRDVNENRRLARQCANDANYDPLTGLINQSAFERRLEQALSSTRQYGMHHALCVLALDQAELLKAGTGAEIAFLRQIMTLFSGTFRERDTLARIDNNAFGLLLEHCPLERAQTIASSIAAHIQDRPFHWHGQSYQIRVSIGLMAVTAEAENPSQMLAHARMACHSASVAGGNRVHTYTTAA